MGDPGIGGVWRIRGWTVLAGPGEEGIETYSCGEVLPKREVRVRRAMKMAGEDGLVTMNCNKAGHGRLGPYMMTSARRGGRLESIKCPSA